MTCRVARLSQDHPGMDLVFCCGCGSANLLHLENPGAACVSDLRRVYALEAGMGKENHVKSPVRGQPVA